ncbi:hypothetical protein D3C84_906280 [compost metagenome]
MPGQGLQGVAQHPAIDQGHQAIALGGRHEAAGADELAVLVLQAQENFQVHALPLVAQGDDLLRVEAEAVLLQGRVDALHPAHLAHPQGQLGVVRLVGVHPVAAFFLGRVAGHVGGAQQRLQAALTFADLHQADADADREGPPVPGEAQILH